MKIFLMIFIIVSFAGCSSLIGVQPWQRVNVQYRPNGTSIVYGQFDEQIRTDMKECNEMAIHRTGARTGEFFSAFFPLDGFAKELKFDLKNDLHYQRCMEAKGYRGFY